MSLGGTASSNHIWIAVGLNMGSVSMTFDSMVAAISNSDFNNAQTVIGGIYTDLAGNPGSLYASFLSVDVAAQTRSIPVTFLTSSPVTLFANTTYWFLLDSPTNASPHIGWSVPSVDGDPVATPPVSYLSTRYTSDSGASWNHLAVSNVTFTVNATSAVPEPSTYAVGIATLLGGIILLRRRRA